MVTTMIRGFKLNSRKTNLRVNSFQKNTPKYLSFQNNNFSKHNYTQTFSFSSSSILKAQDDYIKTTTGVIGYPVVQNGRNILIELYYRYLDALKELPEDDPLRTESTLVINARLQILESDDDLPTIEAKLNVDTFKPVQIEHLIDEIDGDFKVLPVYIKEFVNVPKDENHEVPVMIVTSQESSDFHELRTNFYKYMKSSKLLTDVVNGESSSYASSSNQTYPVNDKAAKKLF